FVLEPLGVQVAVEGFLGDLDRNPVPGETVFLQSASIGSRYQATSDARGKFQFARVQVGDDYRLWTYPRQGLRDYVKTAVSVPASGLEIEILLEPLTLGTLRGAVVDAAGAPVPAFTLWLRSMKALGSSLSLLSDGQGRFEVDSVPEGELIFETRSEPRITVRGLRFMLEPVEDLRLVVDWGRLAAEGSVVDESGSPIPGASVTVTWSAADGPAQSSSFRSGVTDAAGRFTFGDLGPGEHKILATAPGHMPAQGKVDPAAPGDPAVLRLRTKPQRPAEAESPRRP
ncbi:MAG TPA: carboxypeptidase-like regulatory domain-containing protein, partial [Planctomycetota bacterium]|nr:carboxypeptidase-like regulatory domain-containing protein [Planctomycetota bacterium]